MFSKVYGVIYRGFIVDVLIRRLRHKLSADLLVTQHGEGYFLAADVC